MLYFYFIVMLINENLLIYYKIRNLNDFYFVVYYINVIYLLVFLVYEF